MLLPNSLYIALFLRSDPPLPNDFHWALYHHNPTTGGTKYHIRNEGAGWIAAHTPESNILNSFLLVGLVCIATIPPEEIDRMDTVFRSRDTQLNAEGVTCRTWLFGVLGEFLGESQGSLEVLEGRVKEWGNRFSGEASANVQPRPVGGFI